MTIDHDRSGRPRINIVPPVALVDAPVRIHIRGYAPGTEVTVVARMPGDTAWRWEAAGTFRAGNQGEVDPGKQAPLTGTYDGVDPMGLFWSMRPTPADKLALAGTGELAPVRITLMATAPHHPPADATFERLAVARDVTRSLLRTGGLVGTFFAPASDDARPGLLVLGGSDGGLQENLAALLASHGYATLALAYFGIEHLPLHLVEISLDYIEAAISWLCAHPRVRSGGIGVVGGSKGGELALLAGATVPRVRAVVAYAPSGIVLPGLDAAQEGTSSSWAYRGRPLPFAPFQITDEEWLSLLATAPIAQTPLYRSVLRDAPAVAAATIPVERTGGPILLISGTDDQMWPSALFAERVMERLRAHDHRHADALLCYEGAGHGIVFPYLPTTQTSAPYGPTTLAQGGTAAANAHASSDSWPRVLTFLMAHLSL